MCTYLYVQVVGFLKRIDSACSRDGIAAGYRWAVVNIIRNFAIP
jgi:hypothetical protein